MRWKVFQGRKSKSWANSVLPMYMSGSGCVTPGNHPEPHFAIQVGDTLRLSESVTSHGFQRFALSFNRTAVFPHTNIFWLTTELTWINRMGRITAKNPVNPVHPCQLAL